MDISKHAVELTGKLHLRDASDNLLYADDDQKVPVMAVLYGPATKQYRRAQAAQSARFLEKMKVKGKSKLTAEQAGASAEQSESEKIEFLADCTLSFENLEYKGLTGHDLVVAVYSEPTLGFIADQVAKHIGDWGNFTKALPTS